MFQRYTRLGGGKIRDYELYPHTFVGLQGGGQLTFTDFDLSKLITPVGAVSVGHYFTPAVGARLNVGGWKGKSGIDKYNKTFGYNYVTTNLDLLLNLSNIVCPNPDGHLFNAILIGGFGLSYVWDQDDLTDLRANQMVINNPTRSWEENRLVRNFRVGMQFDFNVSKHFGVNLEVTANNYSDRFNSKRNGRGDWQVCALVGLTYKFGFRPRKAAAMSSTMASDQYETDGMIAVATAPTAKVEEAKVPEIKPQPKPQPQPKPEPVVAPKLEKTRAEIFFSINSSVITSAEEAKVRALAEWLKSHPKAKAVMLSGYADAGTGSAAINKRISGKRVNAVANMLSEKYGIERNRLVADSFGDSVQPFADNDRNRVVIVTAEEK